VGGKTFQPSLTFASKRRAYLRGEFKRVSVVHAQGLYSCLMNGLNKLECLSVASIFSLVKNLRVKHEPA
jgi:hypothetical protein